MKKIYLLIIASFVSVSFTSQNAIPNGNFESWTSGTYDVLTGYSNSNPEGFFKCNTPFNVVKTTDFQQGNFAIQLTTYAGAMDTCFGYAVSSTNTNGGNPCQWQGGIPYNQMPTGIAGYYKSNIANPDSGGILVGFRNSGVCLGLYVYKFGGVNGTYTPFSFTFNPPLSGTPDTMIFGAVSSDVFNGIALNGSMFQLDNITLTGTSQPAGLNGDFENWTTQTVDKPSNWYLNTSGDGNGVLKTTDMKAGQYAVELITHLGDNNGVPRASSSGVSTGYYINNCGGSNCQRGGYPFTNQIDTLCFYYKFAPSGNDSANVRMQFKNNFNNVYSTWTNIYTPASAYQYREIPFNTMTTIDSVIVNFESSVWNDSLLVFVGTNFKVDEAHFKSQPLATGIKTFDAATGIKIFPNPSNDGNFVVSNVNTYDLVRVHNVYGQEVSATITKENDYAKIQIANPGAYFVTVNARGKITTLKVIVGKN